MNTLINELYTIRIALNKYTQYAFTLKHMQLCGSSNGDSGKYRYLYRARRSFASITRIARIPTLRAIATTHFMRAGLRVTSENYKLSVNGVSQKGGSQIW